MSRVLGLTVGRNEEHRYLLRMLAHMRDVLDGHFFYDDQSDDATVAVAQGLGCEVRTRPSHVPGFTDDEGMFRGAAWLAFEETMQPQEGDWILVIDCDEVLVATSANEEANTLAEVTRAWLLFTTQTNAHNVAVDLNIPEVFGFSEDSRPLVRVDKLWGTIHAPRLFQYRPVGMYAHGLFGVPAVPQYVMGDRWGNTEALVLMHYGYADRRDQEKKYARYIGKIGHSNNHVDSIMDLPSQQVLDPWRGPYVETMGPWRR